MAVREGATMSEICGVFYITHVVNGDICERTTAEREEEKLT